MTMMSFMMRMISKSNDKKRDAGLVYPEDVIRSENISYGPHKMNVLDVYRPKNGSTKLPVIVSVHGGGWVYGDKELYSHYCVSLAQRGFVVVNFSYRLSPQNKFPTPILPYLTEKRKTEVPFYENAQEEKSGAASGTL